MKQGDRVKMSEAIKTTFIVTGCRDHVNEFGDCIGIVEVTADTVPGTVDVRWQPSGLRYVYMLGDIVRI